MIKITQRADGLLLPGALSVTVTQLDGGLLIAANDTFAPIDQSSVLQAKIDAAKLDAAKIVADLA